MSDHGDSYPRALTPLERELILWVLPSGSAGYGPYLDFIAGASVIGQGRRGEGEIILGAPGDHPDVESPLPPVVSFGVGRTEDDDVSVTVREILEAQMSVEIVGRKRDRVSPGARIEKLWTYAQWVPGRPCPQCGRPAREVEIAPGGPVGRPAVLAICAADHRLWIYDGPTGVCRPMPVTNYYNELMLFKSIRDPETALVSSRLFEHLDGYSDADLAAAFVAYNRVKSKIDLRGRTNGEYERARGVAGRLMDFLFRR